MPRKYRKTMDAADRLIHAASMLESRRKAKNVPAFTDDADMKAKVTLTEAELNAWNQIAAGRPMRNSTAVLQAIKMKMEYTVSKPAQKVESDQKVQIEVVTLGEPPAPPAPPYNPGVTAADDIVKDSPLPEKEDPDA